MVLQSITRKTRSTKANTRRAVRTSKAKAIIRAIVYASAWSVALAQGSRYDNYNVTSAANVQGGTQSTLYTLPGSLVTVCGFPDDGATPCANTVPVYSDAGLTQAVDNPITADAHGRFGFWLAPGNYSYSVQTASGRFVGTYPFSVGSHGVSVYPSINVTNGYTGDIGEMVNAAITANGCATYTIPPGTYTFTHAIHVPHCVSVFGNGEATKLNWTGSGPAVILSDVSAPGQYVQGYFGNVALTGTSTAGQVGIYQGGDPTCTGGCTSNPSTNVGYNYVIRDVVEYYMDNGIVWGNQTFNVEWQNVLLQNNSSYGWYYPATSTGGGQVNHFYHSSMSGNTLGAFNVAQPPQVTFSMYGMDIEYNGSQSAPGIVAMQGGSYTCVDCHVESNFGPFVSMGVNNQTVKFVGGVWVLTTGTTTDPYLVSLNGGKANYSMDGTLLYIQHQVNNLAVETTPSVTATLDIRNLGLYDPSYFLKNVTPKIGAGTYYCLPYNNQTGTTAGSCYNGNAQNAPLITQASHISPTTLAPSSAVMSWNGDGSSGGADLYDTFNSSTNTLYAFRFNANNGGTYTPLASILRSGFINSAGYETNGVVGYTGTKIIGGCTVAFNGGLVTDVTGC